MEEGRRSGDPSGFVVKNRSSSGCLIVRKRGGGGDGVGSSGSHMGFESKKEKKKKRHRMELSDSGSSDELLMPPHRRLGTETIRVCNGLSGFDNEESDIGRKRSRGEDVMRNEVVGMIGRNGEDFSERKRNRLDVFEFDEYDGNDGEILRSEQFDEGRIEGRRFVGSMMVGRSGIEREYEKRSSRQPVVDRRKNAYFERPSGLSRGDYSDRDGARHPISFLRDKYDSDEPIRVQGKNGVLKVMVNKKKKVGGSLNSFDCLESEESRKGLRTEDHVKRNVVIRTSPSFYPESKSVEKTSPHVGTEKKPMNLPKSLPTKNGKVRDRNVEGRDTSIKLGLRNAEAHNSMKTPLSNKNSKRQDFDSDDSDTSLKLGLKNSDTHKSMKGESSGGEKTQCNQPIPTGIKEGKVKRGTGTEKQKLRERIRGMLLNAGWTIDYRPRRNRDYLDAVYINPTGTAYWSIIKAYDALLKQLNDEEDEAKSRGDNSPFTPLSDEVLSQLTRKTRKKIEKEMKKKQRYGSESENGRDNTARRSTSMRHDEDSMDSGSHEEKLSSFIKQGGKSSKNRMNGNGSVNVNSKGQTSTDHLHDCIEKPSSGSFSRQGRKSRKLGRCTLLVRNSVKGLNSESDGFVPYAGKRTLLSWLIDCGTVQLSQKVRYMNRRRTKVMLEGWVTRDGIHCGCCSKILTVSKFEIHAGSKLRQPFQNIYLDSGDSLLDCQIDAWNRQDSIERIGFHSVDIDGEDPNDDTCGLCGDGGDLICCDSCPSTFHQSCLDIKMLPPGDWHCPNCTCKFCGVAGENIVREDDASVSALLTCSLCAKKYHTSCTEEMDGLAIDASGSIPRFCGKKCRELFEHLQGYLGVKHELEAGFSWSLIHRTDADSEISIQGLPQKIECNSKLAVALSVMDECFLPIVDRRSGINLIHNVLYNCGSNFYRLNYSGFYAAVLERGDEIISAASIRFHGTQLAEMPFIGTRHVYRRQGMCRRLFCALELALCCLKVEKLIIPAISELTHTWTEVFGFTTLDDSLKQELKSMNMLVFPGIDMLQKQLLEKENTDGNRTCSTGAKGVDFKDSKCATPEVASKNEIDSSAQHDSNEYENGRLECASKTNDEVTSVDTDSQCPVVSLNDASVMSSSLDASHEFKSVASLKETINADFESGDKLDESALEKQSRCISDTSNDVHVMDDKLGSDSPVEDNIQTHIQGDMAAMDSDASVMSGCLDASDEVKNAVSREGTICVDPESGVKLGESAASRKLLTISNVNGDRQEENELEVGSSVKNITRPFKEDDTNNAHASNLDESTSGELKISVFDEESKCLDSQSEDKFAEPASEGKRLLNSDSSHNAVERETKPMDCPVVVDTKPCKEADSGDTHRVNVDMTCLEVVPSIEEINSENLAKKINGIPFVSVTEFNGADVVSLQITSEPKSETVCEGGGQLDMALEALSETTHCEGRVPHMPEDRPETNVSAWKIDSGSD